MHVLAVLPCGPWLFPHFTLPLFKKLTLLFKSFVVLKPHHESVGKVAIVRKVAIARSI
jgi:hypothetical protein